jgi:hypothetical protein
MQIDVKSFAAKLAKSDYLHFEWLGRIGDYIYSDELRCYVPLGGKQDISKIPENIRVD